MKNYVIVKLNYQPSISLRVPTVVQTSDPVQQKHNFN